MITEVLFEETGNLGNKNKRDTEYQGEKLREYLDLDF